MKLPLLILCFSAPLLCVASDLSSDGLTLLSLLNHWTSVPPSISSSWSSSDSTPCSWVGVQCNRDNSHVVSLNLTTSGVSGQLGPEIGNLNHLQTIVLNRNGFSGIIPSELGNCSLLEYINLSNNQFRGYIPDALTKLQNLRYMNVYSNLLTGKIPDSLFQIPQLEEVYLYYNNIGGPIPSNIGNTTKLLKLYLSGNQLSGTIPPSLGNCSKLEVLFLDGNILEGTLPQSLNNLKNLVYLDVSNNNLFRSSFGFECNPNLKYLAIRNSNISGTIPSSLGNCTNLGVLYLSMNNITGLIPSELGNLANLYDLNLAHNNLEGPLPQQLSDCSRMGRFDVGFNSLTGSLPSSLRNWKMLEYLRLSENNFSGVIPSFLSEYNLLVDLELGGNMFGGEIPTPIGDKLSFLNRLNLSANKLTGNIPWRFVGLQKLEILDISFNNLTGDLKVLTELPSLTQVNISYNFFVGTLPEQLMKYLNSSPSSFLGNPGLCIPCPGFFGLSCSEISNLKLKPCGVDESTSKPKSTNHKFSNLVILIVEIGSPMFVAILLIKLIHLHLSDQLLSWEDVIAYDEEEHELWSLMREHGLENRIIDLRCMEEVMKSTENLDDQYIIGRGGYGTVYKAKFDFGVIAVKKLEVAKSKRKRLSMATEIEIIMKIRHQNVAKSLGYWIGKEYGLIFYTYMENGSLHDVLHRADPPRSLDWNVRYMIAVGIAKGLSYLHHRCDPPIVHRDINPKNILLDSDMEPYITDFGLAITLNQSSTRRMRSTYHLGTRGFIAPEIAHTVEPSSEFDVYSYGVLLLELMTRKKVIDSSFEEEKTTLVGWFKSRWRETREIEEIVDSSLSSELSDLNVVAQVIKVLSVALICTQTDPGKRLKMRDVIKIYESPTDQGICIQNDRTSFHLGSALATATASIYTQARTIVIIGLPGDVKQRELPNLLRWLPGYKASQLSFIHGKPIGYALFNTAHEAVLAKDILQFDLFHEDDLVFDAEANSVLSTEMANKQYFLIRVKHDNFVRSMDNDTNTEHGTDISKPIQQNCNSSGSYNRGKGLCTAGDYPHIDYASATPPSSNHPPPEVQGTYEYLASSSHHPFASLHDVLHVWDPAVTTLEWNLRYKIAVGIAQELAKLLHDCYPHSVHLYISPKTIYLDSDMEPHIGDFGVSMPLNQSSSLTSEPSSYFLEENGYMMEEGVASDIYNFGVVLLELIIGKKALDPSFLNNMTLVGRVRSIWMETRDLDKIVDSILAREFDLNVEVQVTEVLSVALLCTEKDPRKRPTIRTIIKLLGDNYKNQVCIA